MGAFYSLIAGYNTCVKTRYDCMYALIYSIRYIYIFRRFKFKYSIWKVFDPKMSRLYTFYRYDILTYMLKIKILKQLRA